MLLYRKILRKLEKNIGFYTIIFVVLIIANVNKNIKLYESENGIIETDAISYYAYLPAFFIYKDIGLTFKDSTNFKCDYKIWASKTESGKYVIKTTMGVAIAYMPFFLITHNILLIFKKNACGYSTPYKISLIISSLFFLFCGLFFVKRILEVLFNNKTNNWIISFILLTLGFGTNLFFYSVYSPAFSHVFSFAIISAYIYFSIKWINNISWKNSLIIGLLLGWISLIRPTNVIISLFTFFLFIQKYQFIQIFKYYKYILIILIFTLLVWTPQFLYWKFVSGNYFYYSYGSNEKFFFNNPHIFNGLFGFRKGFFIYTPVMFFAFIGFIFLNKEVKKILIPILITTFFYIYITLSWWCWWYGGSLGMRPFIDFYALWSIPLCAFLNYIVTIKKWILKICILSVYLFAFTLNLVYTKQIRTCGLHYDSMTWQAYKCSFLTTKPKCDFYGLLCQPDYELAQKGIDKCYPVNR